MSSPTTLEDLPATLLLQILSYLPIQEAIQASLISPTWRNLWSSLPSLSFEYTVFPSFTTVDAFFHFITGTLIRRSHAALSTLCLTFPFTPDTHRRKWDINSYIAYAVDNNLTSLDLTFHSSYIRWYNDLGFENDIAYEFPFYSLKLSSVQDLCLTRCNLDLGAKISGANQFTSLTSLFLKEVYLTDDMLSDLVKLCGNLEVLTMIRCNGTKHIRICSLKLNKLRLSFYECAEGSVEISAPALRNLCINSFKVGTYVLVDSPALVDGSICFIEEEKNYPYWSKVMRLFSHTHVRNLYCQIWGWGYKAVIDNDLFPRHLSFNSLISLELDTDYSVLGLLGLATLLQQSPNLETIFLSRDLTLYEEVLNEVPPEWNNLKLSLPSLRELTFDLYWGVETDLYILKLLLRDQVVLEKIVLWPYISNGNTAPKVVIAKQANGFQVVEGYFANAEIL